MKLSLKFHARKENIFLVVVHSQTHRQSIGRRAPDGLASNLFLYYHPIRGIPRLVTRVYGMGAFIYGGVFTYMPGTPPYEPLAPPMRVLRMWGVERNPRVSLGRRGARGGGLAVVFWASLVVWACGGGGAPRIAVRGAPGGEGEGVFLDE